MAAKGSQAKTEITNKILEVFDGAFVNDKEIRIPWNEGSEVVQIKVALTCAKVNIEGGAGVAPVQQNTTVSVEDRQITPDEKKEVDDLITRLGL